MKDIHQSVSDGRSRWNRALSLSLAGAGCGLGLLLGGCAVLIGRVSGHKWDLPAMLTGICLGLAWAMWRYSSRKVDDEQIATLMDLRMGGDGRLLFELESGVSTGENLPENLTSPRPDLRRIARSLLPGLAFFAATVLLPVRVPAAPGVDPISERRIDELRQLAEALDGTLELEEELREEIQQNLDALEAQAGQEQPEGEALREALDQLETRLENAAAENAQQLEDNLRDSAEASNQAASEDPTQRENALDELGELAEQMQDDKYLPEDLVDQSMLKHLAEQGLSQESLSMLEKLAKSGQLDRLGNLARDMGLDSELAKKLAEAFANKLSQAALEKLAELAKQGLLNQKLNGSNMPTGTQSDLEEFLRRLENQQPGGT